MDKKVQRFIRAIIVSAIMSVLFLQVINLAIAQSGAEFPNSLDFINTTRRSNDQTAKTHAAEAGNVTAVDIQGDQITSVWQGYYGQVTGDVYLANVANVSLFAWTSVTPQGEVYVANSTVPDWSMVRCANLDDPVNDSAGFPENLTTLEDFFNVTASQSDGIDETFDNIWGGADLFQVASYLTVDAAAGCHYNYTFVSGAAQTNDFVEVILTDNETLIWATVLEPDDTGFDGSPQDFQIMVAEDGRTSGSQTTYYFYVEIE